MGRTGHAERSRKRLLSDYSLLSSHPLLLGGTSEAGESAVIRARQAGAHRCLEERGNLATLR